MNESIHPTSTDNSTPRELEETQERVHSFDPFALGSEHDDSLLAIGAPPLHGVRPLADRRLMQAPLIAALLFAFSSLAYAMHTRSKSLSHMETHAADAMPKHVFEASTKPTPVEPSVSNEVEAGLPVPAVLSPDAMDNARTSEAASEATPATTHRETPVDRRARAPARAARARVPSTSPANATRTLDDLLSQASGEPETSSAPAETSANLPLRPERAHVANVLRSSSSAIRRCGGDGTGVVTARLRFSGATGRASTIAIDGAPAGTEACMRDALRELRLGAFSQNQLEVSFPYRL